MDRNFQTGQTAEIPRTDVLPFIKHGMYVIMQEELDRNSTSWAVNY